MSPSVLQDLITEIEDAMADDDPYEHIAGLAGLLDVAGNHPLQAVVRQYLADRGIRVRGLNDSGESLHPDEEPWDFIDPLHIAVGLEIYKEKGEEDIFSVEEELFFLHEALSGLVFVGDTDLAKLVEKEAVDYVYLMAEFFSDYVKIAQITISDYEIEPGRIGYDFWTAIVNSPASAEKQLEILRQMADGAVMEELPAWLKKMMDEELAKDVN